MPTHQPLIHNLLITSVIITFSLQAASQSFVDINAGILAVSGGSGCWGDYDNDQDLDLLLIGEGPGGNAVTKIYNNDNGSFTEIGAGLQGAINGQASWNDFDNDGDLDILITGENNSEKTGLYINTAGSFNESIHDIAYFGEYSSAAFGDYDNDGDQDLFMTGDWSSILYANLGGGTFLPTSDSFVDLASGRGTWADIDHDGDLDLLVTGNTGGGMKLYLYTNENDGFTETELAGMGLSAGSIEPGDYDSDGDLDLLIMGFNDFVEPEANILRNDGDAIFTNIYAGLPPVTLGRAAWGDYDNDGDLDVAITGKLSGCGVFVSELYENEGNDYFNSANLNLQGAEMSYLAWGDFDNDTDLDLFLCGLTYSGGPFSKIYENLLSLPNFIPNPPSNTTVDFAGNTVILSWSDGSDIQTPAEGLSYNVRLGTMPGVCNTLSPMSELENGYRMIPGLGNVCQENSWHINGLEEGNTYYWSVQTIDHTFAASEFTEEQSFVVTYTGLNEFHATSGITVSPNPAHDKITLDFEETSNQFIDLEVLSLTGERLMQFRTQRNQSVDISGLSKGVYLLKGSHMSGHACSTKLVVR